MKSSLLMELGVELGDGDQNALRELLELGLVEERVEVLGDEPERHLFHVVQSRRESVRAHKQPDHIVNAHLALNEQEALGAQVLQVVPFGDSLELTCHLHTLCRVCGHVMMLVTAHISRVKVKQKGPEANIAYAVDVYGLGQAVRFQILAEHSAKVVTARC